VRPLGGNPASIQYQDLVGIQYRADALSHDKLCALAHIFFQGIFDQGKLTNPLTAVVCEAPTTELGPLAVSFSGGNVTVTWQGGTLQTATDVVGPWTDSTATSPLTEAATGAAKFYRTTAP
jgi:hypothetical protein